MAGCFLGVLITIYNYIMMQSASGFGGTIPSYKQNTRTQWFTNWIHSTYVNRVTCFDSFEEALLHCGAELLEVRAGVSDILTYWVELLHQILDAF